MTLIENWSFESNVKANQNDAWKTSITLLYQKGKLYHSEKNYEDAQKEFLKVDSIAKKHNYIDKNSDFEVKLLYDLINSLKYI